MDMLDLKRARHALKMTQADVARQVGVSLATYLLWERGVGRPNEENLEKLMRVMGAEWCMKEAVGQQIESR